VITEKTVFDAETAVTNKTVHANEILFPTEDVFNVTIIVNGAVQTHE
jgi:hypothetical protein